ncbi:conjugal transfer protein TraD [Sphingobacterium sp. SRCM116780]|uniref:conjugal transfer protein TraD n=1 Tax=Sphingobacterium sp. SRCM116780 TaxID=2907623 RepID=UPI001F325496|nr:conjugal transfer protein TraD [Sphingobacterium sp. SRCM116780]UIR57846.1 conjugal transfer protein TraD [Sphingobacterium sp. SRCM116780]
MDSLLQIVIVICLLVVIFLLSIDKVKIVKSNESEPENLVQIKNPDIMGRANVDSVRQRSFEDKIADKSTIMEPIPKIVEPKTDVKNIITSNMFEDNTIDGEWDDEEFPAYDNRFSQGVSLEELTSVGKLLQQNTLESEQQNLVIDVVQKVQGTELFSVLEDSIEGASKRIAILLDKTLERKSVGASMVQKNDVDDFDINNFV